jgi:PAS domain S-box-containing protein
MAIENHPERSRPDLELRYGRPEDEVFRLLVEAVQDYAIFRLNPDGVIETWNVGAQRIKGYRAEEIIGRHFSVFYPAEDLAWGKPDWELDVAKRVGRFEDEGWRIRKDGSMFWANVVITALFDATGTLTGFGKVTRDLTERRRAEDARTRFIANAAHELRTPLAVLVGLISYLKQASSMTPEQLAEHVQVLTRQADRMHSLVNNLLDLAALDEAGKHLTGQPIRVADSVTRVLMHIPPPPEKHLSTVVGNETVLADEQRLDQILTNLVSNAYAHGGDVIAIAAREVGDSVEIEIADNGPGIEPALQPFVFEPFRRGAQAGPSTGSGLGLAIVKGLAEAYEGNISLDPSAAGARFIITLKKA